MSSRFCEQQVEEAVADGDQAEDRAATQPAHRPGAHARRAARATSPARVRGLEADVADAGAPAPPRLTTAKAVATTNTAESAADRKGRRTAKATRGPSSAPVVSRARCTPKARPPGLGAAPRDHRVPRSRAQALAGPIGDAPRHRGDPVRRAAAGPGSRADSLYPAPPPTWAVPRGPRRAAADRTGAVTPWESPSRRPVRERVEAEHTSGRAEGRRSPPRTRRP